MGKATEIDLKFPILGEKLHRIKRGKPVFSGDEFPDWLFNFEWSTLSIYKQAALDGHGNVYIYKCI